MEGGWSTGSSKQECHINLGIANLKSLRPNATMLSCMIVTLIAVGTAPSETQKPARWRPVCKACPHSFICSSHKPLTLSRTSLPPDYFFAFQPTLNNYQTTHEPDPIHAHTTATMFTRSTTILALFAVAARVAYANPPACLLAAVRYNTPRLHS